LTERIVEEGDAFVEALTHEFGTTEVDTLLELGERIYSINRVLSALPEEDEPPKKFSNPDFGEGLGSSVICTEIPVATWADFIERVEAQDRETASRILCGLARLRLDVATKATHIFASQYYLDETFAGKARSLRAQLMTNRQGSLTLIRELFGIGGKAAIEIYESLKATV
jgi:hypothetical protein